MEKLNRQKLFNIGCYTDEIDYWDDIAPESKRLRTILYKEFKSLTKYIGAFELLYVAKRFLEGSNMEPYRKMFQVRRTMLTKKYAKDIEKFGKYTIVPRSRGYKRG